MNRQERVLAASLIRYAVKYMDVHGWQHHGAYGISGQVCPAMAVVKSGQENGFPVPGKVVTLAVEALDDTAAGLAPSEWASDPSMNYLARYNEHPDRTPIEVKNLMGHTANKLVNSQKRPR